VKKILKYENDRGGPRNTIDFKVETTLIADPTEADASHKRSSVSRSRQKDPKGDSRCADGDKKGNEKSRRSA